MATSTKPKESIDFLYPDLLSKEGLLHILKDRYVQISSSDLETLDKEALVELYNKYVIPLPQRHYRDNLRGKEMRKKQVLRDKKRKIPLAEGFVSPPITKKQRLSQSSEGCPSGPSRGLVNHQLSPLGADGGSRLKPPPSCIDTSRKVVRLSSSSSSSASTPSSTVTSSTLTSTSVREENMDVSSEASVASSGSTVIKLGAGDKSNGELKRPTSDNQEEDGKSSPQKKISKITWP